MVTLAHASEMFTPAQVAVAIGVRKVDVVYSHIKAGRLVAVNVGCGQSRPCWRISASALAAFLAARTTTPPPAQPCRRRGPRPKATAYF
jgi:hypothetical protein